MAAPAAPISLHRRRLYSSRVRQEISGIVNTMLLGPLAGIKASWPRLHIDDGQLPTDNNRVENQIADRLRVGRIVLVRLDVDHGAIRVKHG